MDCNRISLFEGEWGEDNWGAVTEGRGMKGKIGGEGVIGVLSQKGGIVALITSKYREKRPEGGGKRRGKGVCENEGGNAVAHKSISKREKDTLAKHFPVKINVLTEEGKPVAEKKQCNCCKGGKTDG